MEGGNLHGEELHPEVIEDVKAIEEELDFQDVYTETLDSLSSKYKKLDKDKRVKFLANISESIEKFKGRSNNTRLHAQLKAYQDFLDDMMESDQDDL
jgi:hypothetical protein